MLYSHRGFVCLAADLDLNFTLGGQKLYGWHLFFALRLGCALFSLFPTSAFDFWTKDMTSVESEFLHIPFLIIISTFKIPLLPFQIQSVQNYIY